MDKQTAIRIIGQRLSGRTPQDLDAFIAGEMELVQDGILEGKAFVPWFLSEVWDTTVGPSTQVRDLPADFLKADLEEGAFIPLEDGMKKEVLPTDWVSASEYYGSGLTPASGLPNYYALFGANRVQFFPTLNKEYSLIFSYLKKDTPIGEVADSGDNLWLRYAPNVFVNEVGMVCAEIVRDKDAYQLFQRRVQEAWRDLEARDTERRLAGQELYFF